MGEVGECARGRRLRKKALSLKEKKLGFKKKLQKSCTDLEFCGTIVTACTWGRMALK